MPTPKQAHALVTYYTQKYQEKYERKPVTNRHAARWGFDSLLMDVGESEARELIDYYFETVSTNGHSLDWFLYNYEKLMVSKTIGDEDKRERERLRAESKRRAEEWRNRIGRH